MPDTARTRSALQSLFADNSSGDISAQDARDLIVSVPNVLDEAPVNITLSSNTNNWAPNATAQGYLVTVASNYDITGLTAASNGVTRWLWNVGTGNITLKHQSSSSSAANRFTCVNNADIVLNPGQVAQFLYDGSSWRVVA